MAASSAVPSKWLPRGFPNSGKKWSQVQMLSSPSSSASLQALRRSSIEECCGRSETPTLNFAATAPIVGALVWRRGVPRPAVTGRGSFPGDLRRLGRLDDRGPILVVGLVLPDALLALPRELDHARGH